MAKLQILFRNCSTEKDAVRISSSCKIELSSAAISNRTYFLFCCFIWGQMTQQPETPQISELLISEEETWIQTTCPPFHKISFSKQMQLLPHSCWWCKYMHLLHTRICGQMLIKFRPDRRAASVFAFGLILNINVNNNNNRCRSEKFMLVVYPRWWSACLYEHRNLQIGFCLHNLGYFC